MEGNKNCTSKKNPSLDPRIAHRKGGCKSVMWNRVGKSDWKVLRKLGNFDRQSLGR